VNIHRQDSFFIRRFCRRINFARTVEAKHQKSIFAAQKSTMKRKYTFIPVVFLVLALSFGGYSQQADTTDRPEAIPMIYPAYAFQWPGGDLADSFGPASNIGLGFLMKSHKNWLVGVDLNFIFGNKIRIDSLLQNLYTSDGYIIDQEGQYAEMGLYERGFYSSFKLGKVIPVFGSNKNSGLMLLFGGGYLQHKVRIEIKNNNVPQLDKTYRKGYDRLTDGFQVNQFIGYMHIGDSRLANFFAGVELVESWTKNRRSMNFDTRRRDDKERFDMLYGIKIGWIIPFIKRMPKDFYYY
jgi:hypothetical protein